MQLKVFTVYHAAKGIYCILNAAKGICCVPCSYRHLLCTMQLKVFTVYHAAIFILYYHIYCVHLSYAQHLFVTVILYFSLDIPLYHTEFFCAWH